MTSNLERYRHVAPLGSGGMSTVELAEDTLLGRRVALKRMHRDDLRSHSRLRREALIGASLTHPNLVSIFDIFTTDDGDDVIVMEYIEGETVAERLRRAGKPDLETALRILTGVSAGLDAIHAQQIVHRDVKPANILLGQDGSVKLADLGIAAVADRTKITTDGAVLGTFSYMAPEQLEGAQASPAVDVYALAAVAYELLSGKRARTEGNPVALAHAISTQPPPDLRAAWPEAPPGVADVLTRGMSRDPGQRPRSAGELTARVRAALEPQTTAPIAPVRRTRQPAAARPTAPRRVPAAVAVGSGRPPQRTSRPVARAPVRQSPRPLARPSSPPPARRGRVPALALAGLALAAVAAIVIFAATSGGSKHAPRVTASTSSRHRAKAKPAPAPPPAGGTAAAGASSTPSSTGAGSSGSSSPATSSAGAASSGTGSSVAPATAGSPVAAVESFYHLAASHNYNAAWALADPAFRNQLGGYQSFEGGQAGDRSITFTSANVTNQSPDSATVYVRTTSVRYNGTQHCYGPVSLVRGSSGWVLDHIDINCT